MLTVQTHGIRRMIVTRMLFVVIDPQSEQASENKNSSVICGQIVTFWEHAHLQILNCIEIRTTLPLIALLALSVSFELASSSARVASVKSQQGVGGSDIRTQRSDPRFTCVR